MIITWESPFHEPLFPYFKKTDLWLKDYHFPYACLGKEIYCRERKLFVILYDCGRKLKFFGKKKNSFNFKLTGLSMEI